MNHLKIFFITISIFLVVLFLTGLVFFINTPGFEKYFKTEPSPLKAAQLLVNHIIGFHRYFIIFSLFITMAVCYAFVNLNWFNVRHYVTAITAVPFLICAGIYYFENYIFNGLFRFNSLVTITIPAEDYFINNINDLKIFHFMFILFIIIPGSVLVNNKKWHLKTFLFLLAYLLLAVYAFKYANSNIFKFLEGMDDLKKIDEFFKIKKLPEIKEVILSIIYIPLGIYLFKIADSVRHIKKRIDIGKIKKIQR